MDWNLQSELWVCSQSHPIFKVLFYIPHHWLALTHIILLSPANLKINEHTIEKVGELVNLWWMKQSGFHDDFCYPNPGWDGQTRGVKPRKIPGRCFPRLEMCNSQFLLKFCHLRLASLPKIWKPAWKWCTKNHGKTTHVKHQNWKLGKTCWNIINVLRSAFYRSF